LQLPATSMHSRLNQLPFRTRRALSLLLAAAAIGFLVLVVAGYFQLTPPSSLLPEFGELDRLIFEAGKPRCQIERLLEANDATMSGGSMRPAFTEKSVGWEAAIKDLMEAEMSQLIAEREGERLAVLDWIRSGASREEYEKDNHLLDRSPAIQ